MVIGLVTPKRARMVGATSDSIPELRDTDFPKNLLDTIMKGTGLTLCSVST